MDGNKGSVYKINDIGWFFRYHLDIIEPSRTRSEAIAKGINYRKKHTPWLETQK